MAKEEGFQKELAALLKKYGLSEDLPANLGSLSGGGNIGNIAGDLGNITAIPGPAKLSAGGGLVASYIREIITGDVGFDERILTRVGTVLQGFGTK